MENVSALCGLIPVECFVKMFGCSAAPGITIVRGTKISVCLRSVPSPSLLQSPAPRRDPAAAATPGGAAADPELANLARQMERFPLYLFILKPISHIHLVKSPKENVWRVRRHKLKGNWAKHMSHSGFLTQPTSSRLPMDARGDASGALGLR